MRLPRALSLILCLLVAGAAEGLSQTRIHFDSRAENAILLDVESDTVLYEKNARTPVEPASMSKLMTLELVFQALANGALSQDDTVPVSARAAGMRGSRMFLRAQERVSILDLLRGVIVQSGNDASVALAEAMAGTEEAFVRQMNARAQELGLGESHFVNATGWPHDEHRTSLHDLARLARHLVIAYPNHYPLFAERSFTWAGITQRNRNTLLGEVEGVDGLKTGHTQSAGYGLVVSAKRGKRRIVGVVAGMKSEPARSVETEKLLEWGFRAFAWQTVRPAGARMTSVAVRFGDPGSVEAELPQDVTLFGPRSAEPEEAILSVRRLEAPIRRGEQIATIRFAFPGYPARTYPLLASADVRRKGFFGRLRERIVSALSGASGAADGAQ